MVRKPQLGGVDEPDEAFPRIWLLEQAIDQHHLSVLQHISSHALSDVGQGEL